MKKRNIHLKKLRLERETILPLANRQLNAIVGGSVDPALCPATNPTGEPHTATNTSGTRYPVESIRNCPSSTCNTQLSLVAGCSDSIDKCYAP